VSFRATRRLIARCYRLSLPSAITDAPRLFLQLAPGYFLG
jgi:hypothetical protein